MPVPGTGAKFIVGGDALRARRDAGVPVPGTGAKFIVGPTLDLIPVIDLITSTVARGTWTVDVGRDQATIINGRLVETKDGAATPKTVGVITPFFLSVSLIVRHTAEVHDEVANLLRKLRRLQESWQPPEQTHDPKPAPRPTASLPIAMPASAISWTSSARRSRSCPGTVSEGRHSIPDPARARPGAAAGFSRRTGRIAIDLG